jgi:hypothetical protein
MGPEASARTFSYDAQLHSNRLKPRATRAHKSSWGQSMHRTTIVIAVGLALAVTLPAAPAKAANLQSFVSSHGSDSSTCTAAAPCLTFAHAITQTVAGGEINVADAADYGPLIIGKAISIVNDGAGTANIRPLSGAIGITISAGAGDAVILRGLTIDGVGFGATGIQFNTGKSLTVVNCVIRRVTHSGINFVPNAASNLSVSNSLVTDNGDSGIVVQPTGVGLVTAVFNRVEVNNNLAGIALQGSNSTGTIKATVVDSVAAHNGSFGFVASTNSSQAPTKLMLFHSVAANNGTGLEANGTGATVRAFQMMLTGNTNGWTAFSGGGVQSYGNNSIDGNTGNETAPPSIAQK